MRRRLPRIVVGIVGSLLILKAFVPRPGPAGPTEWQAFFAYIDENFSVWFNILAVFAFGLGAASLLKVHGGRVLRRQRDWPYSLAGLIAFGVVLVAGLARVGGDPSDAGSTVHWIFRAVISPLQASIFALLAFYIASASYRAFRVRSREAAALLAAALIILLGRTPFGHSLTDWLPASLSFLRLENVALWVVQVPNTAGQRAITIGIALGTVAMSLRLLLGIERGLLGRGES
jgi:hypothetical protein